MVLEGQNHKDLIDGTLYFQTVVCFCYMISSFVVASNIYAGFDAVVLGLVYAGFIVTTYYGVRFTPSRTFYGAVLGGAIILCFMSLQSSIFWGQYAHCEIYDGSGTPSPTFHPTSSFPTVKPSISPYPTLAPTSPDMRRKRSLQQEQRSKDLKMELNSIKQRYRIDDVDGEFKNLRKGELKTEVTRGKEAESSLSNFAELTNAFSSSAHVAIETLRSRFTGQAASQSTVTRQLRHNVDCKHTSAMKAVCAFSVFMFLSYLIQIFFMYHFKHDILGSAPLDEGYNKVQSHDGYIHGIPESQLKHTIADSTDL